MAEAPRLAIVHDYLNQYGGAERVLEVLHAIYPDAPIYTSIYDQSALPDGFRAMDIRPSFLQHLPLSRKLPKAYLLLYPAAVESFDLRGYDVVLSSSSAWARGVITSADTLHICYCYTPMRFGWRYHDYVEREQFGPFVRAVCTLSLPWIRQWDVAAALRPDHYIASCHNVARRIRKTCRREATVIPPPVDCARWHPPRNPEGFFLIASRLRPYKRIDLAVQAFDSLGLPLKIAGHGSDAKRLRSMAGPNIEFLGFVSDEELSDLYGRCQALVFTGEEDFGLAPLEANAAGCPVIALAAGGALETVVEGQTGMLFSPDTPAALADTVRRFDPSAFDADRIRAHAQQFSAERFEERIRGFVDEKLREHRSTP
jgi:glycosyltransferase involved in cell wall biosynthesis